MIGDNLATDILGARRRGFDFAPRARRRRARAPSTRRRSRPRSRATGRPTFPATSAGETRDDRRPTERALHLRRPVARRLHRRARPSACGDAEPRRADADGVLFENHYGQCTPCGPSRTSLLTGLYLMNHRSGRNGTPLDARFTNVALEARRRATTRRSSATPTPRSTRAARTRTTRRCRPTTRGSCRASRRRCTCPRRWRPGSAT